ncbi:MAG: response regulator transcription factor [Candidatus Promineifilaceae bacterium]
MSDTILIIEDEKRIAEWTQRYFERAGFQTLVAHDGITGLTLAQQQAPDLIILDLMLPGIDGVEICRRLRTESDVPIIMLTARGAQQDRINGLDIGADDYIVKPFDPKEVVARAKAVLRRVQGTIKPTMRVGDFELLTQQHRILLNGQPLSLSQQQYEILAIFIRHPNQVMTREQIIQAAMADFDGFDRAIDTHIRRIRRQVEPNPRQPRYIHTVYGVGYRFTGTAS